MQFSVMYTYFWPCNTILVVIFNSQPAQTSRPSSATGSRHTRHVPPHRISTAMWIGRYHPDQGTSQTTPHPFPFVNRSLPHSFVSPMLLLSRGSPITTQPPTDATSRPHHGVHQRLLRPFKYAALGSSLFQKEEIERIKNDEARAS